MDNKQQFIGEHLLNLIASVSLLYIVTTSHLSEVCY